MAELLVALNPSNYTHPDPGKDAFVYKKGHVVTVKPDGWKWAKGEAAPVFTIVKIPGEPVKKYENTIAGDDTKRRIVQIDAAYTDSIAVSGASVSDAVIQTKIKPVSAVVGP